jgi:hypothetical protein
VFRPLPVLGEDRLFSTGTGIPAVPPGLPGGPGLFIRPVATGNSASSTPEASGSSRSSEVMSPTKRVPGSHHLRLADLAWFVGARPRLHCGGDITRQEFVVEPRPGAGPAAAKVERVSEK